MVHDITLISSLEDDRFLTVGCSSPDAAGWLLCRALCNTLEQVSHVQIWKIMATEMWSIFSKLDIPQISAQCPANKPSLVVSDLNSDILKTLWAYDNGSIGFLAHWVCFCSYFSMHFLRHDCAYYFSVQVWSISKCLNVLR